MAGAAFAGDDGEPLFLKHCEGEIKDFLGATKRILFIPYALKNMDDYEARVRRGFERMGFALHSIHHHEDDPVAAVEAAQALFMGGGNAFRLLDGLYERNLLGAIRRRVRNGMPYVGSSAGSEVACVSIKTTSDMPILQPPSFDALGLVPFNLNVHFKSKDPKSTHMGESRETRIQRFHEENDYAAIGLPEGTLLRREGAKLVVKGHGGAVLFWRGGPKSGKPLAIGGQLDELLAPGNETQQGRNEQPEHTYSQAR